MTPPRFTEPPPSLSDDDGATCLFVYGTLRRDASGLARQLMRGARFEGYATTPGLLYRVDGYPALVTSAQAPGDGAAPPRVTGELYRTPAMTDLTFWGPLDAWEEYERAAPQAGPYRLLEALTTKDDGSSRTALVYAYVGVIPADSTPIASGDVTRP